MKHFSSTGLVLTVIQLCCSTSAANARNQPDVAGQVRQIFQQRCQECHSGNNAAAGLDLTSKVSLLGYAPGGVVRFVDPADPTRSVLWTAIENDSMPRGGKPLTQNEKDLVFDWIRAGAPFPAPAGNVRPQVTRQQELAVIRDDLQQIRQTLLNGGRNAKAVADHLGRQRYFSLRVQYNDPDLTQADLAMYRAAFSKVVNSLSRTSRVIVPETVQTRGNGIAAETLLRIDLGDFGWDVITWSSVVAAYPYALEPSAPQMKEIHDQIRELIGPVRFDGFAPVRIDWFVSVATRPPLYHVLLNTPQTLQELENQLGIQRLKDLLQPSADYLRFGVTRSGVSAFNRIVDRHTGERNRYYWISYDFSSGAGRRNIVRFPLGPSFDGNPFPAHAFDHDGGEVVYELPNGLQGYMLVDAQGRRIDEGPTSIVWDRGFTSGTPAIVNGLSCMACHSQGMKYPLGEQFLIRDSVAVFGNVRASVEQRQPKWKQVKLRLDRDRNRFLGSLAQAMDPFLKPLNPDVRVKDVAEPVRLVVLAYQADLSLDDAARELEIDPQSLRIIIQRTAVLKEQGLLPLTAGIPPRDGVGRSNVIPRSTWDFREPDGSAFQRAALQLDIGVPQ